MTLVPKAGGVVMIKPSFLLETRIKRRLGNGSQHADHGADDPRVLDEDTLGFEDRRVVAVETQDHAAPDLHAGLLDGVDLLQHRPAFSEILELLGFAQRCFVRRLDADKDNTDIGIDHELHQLVIVGKIDRGFGKECHWIVVAFLPGHDVAQDLLDRLLVADEIVIDDKRRVDSGGQ